jgi:hypothetical protein
MAKLTATERKMVAEIIVDKIKESYTDEHKEQAVEEFLASKGVPNAIQSFKDAIIKHNEFDQQIKVLTEKRDAYKNILRNEPEKLGYSWPCLDYHNFINHNFERSKKEISLDAVQKDLLIANSDDLSSLIETLVAKYTEQNAN